MRVRFEEDERFVIAMFKKNCRTEMLTLVNSTLKKMEQLTDQEFSVMDLEEYRQEPAEGEE